jgi:hypothetical protein
MNRLSGSGNTSPGLLAAVDEVPLLHLLHQSDNPIYRAQSSIKAG